jgi:ferric-dicitrate binding protein FerR (iron transport regulator)
MSDKHDKQLESLLKDYPMPDAEPGFYAAALARATERGARRRRWAWSGIGSAVAAGLAAWVVFAFLLGPATEPPIAGVTLAVAEPQTVNLMFSSELALDNATLTIILPPGVELDRFPGQREVSWTTSLAAGKNLLPLQIRATGEGEILARLSHEDRSRTFKLHIDVS